MTDVYLEAIRAFNRKRVAHLVIGVSGINYYAADPSQLVMTADFDVLLKPEAANVRKAVAVMRRLDFTVSAGGKAVKDLDEKGARALIAEGRTLACANFYGNLIELLLAVSGFDYEELDRDAIVFRAGPTRIRVGRLEKLLRMKEIAARPKDILFLEKYRLLLEGCGGEDPPVPRKR